MSLRDNAGNPVGRARMSLEGHMSHAGMTPVHAIVTELEPGIYLGTLDLTMPGDWVIIVHIGVPGEFTFDRQFEIKGVLPA